MEFEHHEPSDQYPKGTLVMKVTRDELFGRFGSDSSGSEADEDLRDPMFDTGELQIITDIEKKYGPEGARIAGDVILEIKKAEESHG